MNYKNIRSTGDVSNINSLCYNAKPPLGEPRDPPHLEALNDGAPQVWDALLFHNCKYFGSVENFDIDTLQYF